MNDSLNALKEKYEQLEQEVHLDERTRELVADLFAEVRRLQASNQTLRRTMLKASSKESRMSSKLRDALYE